MHRIIEVKPARGYVLEVEFSDGAFGKVDLSDRLFGPMFEPLLDQNLFNQVGIDEYGAVFWPNGADLAPDALYETIQRDAAGGELQPVMHLQNPDNSNSSLLRHHPGGFDALTTRAQVSGAGATGEGQRRVTTIHHRQST